MQEYNLRRGLFKRHIKRFYYACRRFDEGLRAKMNAHEAAMANRPAKSVGAARAGASGATASAVAGAKALSVAPRQESPLLQLGTNGGGTNEPMRESAA